MFKTNILHILNFNYFIITACKVYTEIEHSQKIVCYIPNYLLSRTPFSHGNSVLGYQFPSAFAFFLVFFLSPCFLGKHRLNWRLTWSAPAAWFPALVYTQHCTHEATVLAEGMQCHERTTSLRRVRSLRECSAVCRRAQGTKPPAQTKSTVS